ncbi:uncharacterized protein ACN427_012721 [Glossina fuscipes fuscipes]
MNPVIVRRHINTLVLSTDDVYVKLSPCITLQSFIVNKWGKRQDTCQKSLQDRQAIYKLWQRLTEKLNSVGLPKKNVTDWRKTWTAYKYRTKRKSNKNLLSRENPKF